MQDLEIERSAAPHDSLVFDWNESVREGDEDAGLREVTVTLIDEAGAERMRWTFANAWIKHYGIPPIDATFDDHGVPEYVTVAFESMSREEL